MRWFKHLSLAAEDEKLAEVLELHGAEGYGAYWLILEKIAFLMDGTDKTSARYSVKKWAKFCGKSPKVFKNFLETFEKLSLYFSEVSGKDSEFLIISCPNLLKYRDEYSKKSGQTTDNISTDSGQTPDQDRDTELDTELDLDKSLPQNEFAGDDQDDFYTTKKKRKLTGKRFETFNRFWSAFDYKKGKADAADSWIDIPQLTDKLVNEICKSAKIEASNRSKLISEGRTPIFPQGWLTARRWEDESTEQGNKAGPSKSAQKSIDRANKYIDS